MFETLMIIAIALFAIMTIVVLLAIAYFRKQKRKLKGKIKSKMPIAAAVAGYVVAKEVGVFNGIDKIRKHQKKKKELKNLNKK